MNIPYRQSYTGNENRVVPRRQHGGDSGGDSSKQRGYASVLPDGDVVEDQPLVGMVLNPIAHNYRVVAKSSYDLGAALSPIIRRASLDHTQKSTYDFLSELVFFYVHVQPLDVEVVSGTQITEIIQCVINDHVSVKRVIHAVFLGLNKQHSVNYNRFQTLLMSIVMATSVLSVETIQSVVQYVLGAIESLSIKKRSEKERFLRDFSTKVVRYYSKKRAIVIPAVLESVIQTTIGFMERSFSEETSMQHLCSMIKLFLGTSDVMDVHTQRVFAVLDPIPNTDTQAELRLAWQAYYECHVQKYPKQIKRTRLESLIIKQRYAERWCQCIRVLSQTDCLSSFTPSWLKAFQADFNT